jgi:hypothetical protein
LASARRRERSTSWPPRWNRCRHLTLWPQCFAARDARNADALADALLNPRDRAYSVPQFYDFIERSGLAMARWNWQAPYLPQCGSIAGTPHATRLAALPAREQHAAMELWRGTMVSHSAIVRRSDADAAPQLRFDAQSLLAYVPHRLPWTHVVEERLPAGAAGALVNRSHPFPDLALVIDAKEKQMFERIDGRRSIADITDSVPPVDSGRVGAFFGRLWRYDQVVFDASPAR